MGGRNIRPFRKPSGDLVARVSGGMISRPERLDETLVANGSPAMDVALLKADRRRRYVIRPGQSASEWYCQVWFGDRQHRGARVTGVLEAQRLLAQYQREIADLTADGWTRT